MNGDDIITEQIENRSVRIGTGTVTCYTVLVRDSRLLYSTVRARLGLRRTISVKNDKHSGSTMGLLKQEDPRETKRKPTAG